MNRAPLSSMEPSPCTYPSISTKPWMRRGSPLNVGLLDGGGEKRSVPESVKPGTTRGRLPPDGAGAVGEAAGVVWLSGVDAADSSSAEPAGSMVLGSMVLVSSSASVVAASAVLW